MPHLRSLRLAPRPKPGLALPTHPPCHPPHQPLPRPTGRSRRRNQASASHRTLTTHPCILPVLVAELPIIPDEDRATMLNRPHLLLIPARWDVWTPEATRPDGPTNQKSSGISASEALRSRASCSNACALCSSGSTLRNNVRRSSTLNGPRVGRVDLSSTSLGSMTLHGTTFHGDRASDFAPAICGSGDVCQGLLSDTGGLGVAVTIGWHRACCCGRRKVSRLALTASASSRRVRGMAIGGRVGGRRSHICCLL